MQLNDKLAIVIPVYNRAQFLARSLEIHVPLAEKYGVGIYISDNCSEDNTAEIVRGWMERSPYVFYSCNEENIGPDRNFEAALRMPEAEYVWLLGDTYRLPDFAINYILNLLAERSDDVIIVNLGDKVSIAKQPYQDFSKMLAELSIIISCLSCLIYNKRLISAAAFSRYYETCFIQTGILLEYIAGREASVFWAGDLSIGGLDTPELKKTSWVNTARVAEIGVEKWVNFIFSLPPSYSLAAKLKAARNFGLLNWRGIAIMRAEGFLTLEIIRLYKDAFWLAVPDKKKFYALFVLARVPIAFVRHGVESIRRWRNRNND